MVEEIDEERLEEKLVAARSQMGSVLARTVVRPLPLRGQDDLFGDGADPLEDMYDGLRPEDRRSLTERLYDDYRFVISLPPRHRGMMVSLLSIIAIPFVYRVADDPGLAATLIKWIALSNGMMWTSIFCAERLASGDSQPSLEAEEMEMGALVPGTGR